MTDYLALPSGRRIQGVIDAPSSKSVTNRALVLGALSPEAVEIVRPLRCDDTDALATCLEAMGARIEASAQSLTIRGPLCCGDGGEVRLDARESGTASRFLAAIAAVTPGRFLLTGSARLRERPMQELLEALRSLGASFQFREKEGYLPIAISGGSISGRVRVDASRSSQFLSALLLAAAATEDGLEIEAAGPVASAPYVAMTVDLLRAFGHSVSPGPLFRVKRGRQDTKCYRVPGDFSSAVPLLAAAGISGGELVVRGLLWPSLDADARAIPALESMGLSVRARSGEISVSRTRDLKPVRVTATDFPDAVPALAALAAFAPGESRFDGIGHLRFKESDRIEALIQLLTRAGARAQAEAGALIVWGPLPGSEGPVCLLPTANDHRIVMAAALLCLGRPGMLIESPGSVAKSYPLFFRDLETIAAPHLIREPTSSVEGS